MSPEIRVAGADALSKAEGSIGALYRSGVADPAGVIEQGTHAWGLPRNLGDPVDLASGAYRQAKETKCGEKGDRESERLVVPVKRGNPPRGDPVEGRGRRDAEPLKGKMMETPNSAIVSTKLRRIATLACEMPGPKVRLVRRFGLP